MHHAGYIKRWRSLQANFSSPQTRTNRKPDDIFNAKREQHCVHTNAYEKATLDRLSAPSRISIYVSCSCFTFQHDVALSTAAIPVWFGFSSKVEDVGCWMWLGVCIDLVQQLTSNNFNSNAFCFLASSFVQKVRRNVPVHFRNYSRRAIIPVGKV